MSTISSPAGRGRPRTTKTTAQPKTAPARKTTTARKATTQRSTQHKPAIQGPGRRKGAARTRRVRWRDSAAWQSPVTSYYLIGGVSLLLLALGLIMVLSSSSIYSLASSDGASAFADFFSQAAYALIAVPLAFGLSRLPVRAYRSLAWVAMLVTLAMQALVFTPLARADGGNANWVHLAPGVTVQPSEFAKLGLALWLGVVLAAKGRLLEQWRHIFVPALVVSALFVGTVLYSHDLGTALIYVALIAGALWVAGVPASKFLVGACVAVALVGYLAFSSENRTHRIMHFLGLAGGDSPAGTGYQTLHAMRGLGSGGLSGVGLGASKEKWLWLPAGDNDFIFAVIGEELGFLGSLFVLVLFLMLAVGMCRLIMRHPDPFVKIATAGIACWILGQAVVNIGVAIGVLPVIGLPLPLVSKGGSSLVATIGALGVVLAFARDEPGAKEALAARRGSMRRSLAVISPRRSARGRRA